MNVRGKSALTNRQIETARAIYNESVANGIDPRLTLSMAYQESTLGIHGVGDKSRGGDHAMGSMQVLRSTAKSMGKESDWLKSKESFLKTGKSDVEADARMGVGYVKFLRDKYGATTLGDLSAGYNGGPAKVGKNYGNAFKHVDKVSRHYGRFFGNGEAASFKTTGLIGAGGNFATFKPASPSEMPTGAPDAPSRKPNLSDLMMARQGQQSSDGASDDMLAMLGQGQSSQTAPQQAAPQQEAYVPTIPSDARQLLIGSSAMPVPQQSYEASYDFAQPEVAMVDPRESIKNILTQRYNEMYEIDEEQAA